MIKKSIYDLDGQALSTELSVMNQPKFRYNQLMEGLYGSLYQDFTEFSAFPSTLRVALDEKYLISPVKLQLSITSHDELTQKALFQLQDGLTVETVLMRYEARNSLCVSTQVGCPMGCVFCATGQMGFTRNLSQGEILGQIFYFMRQLRAEGQSLTNLVYMGMGEPFLNYENVMSSIHTMTDPEKVNFGARRITISTVGILSKLEAFTAESSQVNLAVSLHAPNNELRSRLVPANRIFPLPALIKACGKYTSQTHRRITFEYALIDGVNDSDEYALELAELIKGMLCHVNLIALNPSKDYPLQGSPREKVAIFKETLEAHGIPTTIRVRRGIEINAGCGQLASAAKSV